jgi:hypothetical protein
VLDVTFWNRCDITREAAAFPAPAIPPMQRNTSKEKHRVLREAGKVARRTVRGKLPRSALTGWERRSKQWRPPFMP